MLIEVRTLDTISKQHTIRSLQQRGLLGKYINKYGYICFKQEELDEYNKYKRRGRPPKIIRG